MFSASGRPPARAQTEEPPPPPFPRPPRPEPRAELPVRRPAADRVSQTRATRAAAATHATGAGTDGVADLQQPGQARRPSVVSGAEPGLSGNWALYVRHGDVSLWGSPNLQPLSSKERGMSAGRNRVRAESARLEQLRSNGANVLRTAPVRHRGSHRRPTSTAFTGHRAAQSSCVEARGGELRTPDGVMVSHNQNVPKTASENRTREPDVNQ